jgi:tetratricopeptide (TPR) repeat protein
MFVALLISADLCQANKSPSEKQVWAEIVLKERMQLLESAEYDSYVACTECQKNMIAAQKSGDYEKVIIEADNGLKVEPYSLKYLMSKASALRSLGKIQEADEVRAQWFSIADSIFLFADGKSKETAFTVIRVDEEYSILNLLNLKPDKQSLLNDGDRVYDLIEATNRETKEKTTIYFDITTMFTKAVSKYKGSE